MNYYENTYFGIRLDFPESWRFRYWGNRKSKNQMPEWMQSSYDDLPTFEIPRKDLFDSVCAIKESPHIMSRQIFVSIFYRPNGFDFDDEIIESKHELKRNNGLINFMDKESKYSYIEIQHEDTVEYRKYIYWEHKPNIWLAAAFIGDTKDNYLEAEKVFNKLHHTTTSRRTGKGYA